MSASAKREIKQERAARTREEILEAAIQEFSRHSFLGASMAQLAKRIRMTPGALYWHFKTKEDLLLGALEELNARFLREFEFLTREARSLTARQQLAYFLDRAQAFFRYHRHYGRFFGMLTALSSETNERVAEAVREVLAAYAGAVARIIRYGQKKTGEFRSDVDALAFGHALVASFCGIIVHQALFEATLGYDPVTSALERITLQGVSTPPELLPHHLG